MFKRFSKWIYGKDQKKFKKNTFIDVKNNNAYGGVRNCLKQRLKHTKILHACMTNCKFAMIQ